MAAAPLRRCQAQRAPLPGNPAPGATTPLLRLQAQPGRAVLETPRRALDSSAQFTGAQPVPVGFTTAILQSQCHPCLPGQSSGVEIVQKFCTATSFGGKGGAGIVTALDTAAKIATSGMSTYWTFEKHNAATSTNYDTEGLPALMRRHWSKLEKK